MLIALTFADKYLAAPGRSAAQLEQKCRDVQTRLHGCAAFAQWMPGWGAARGVASGAALGGLGRRRRRSDGGGGAGARSPLVDAVVTATVLPRAHNTAVRALRELGTSAHRPVFRRADALQQLPCGAEEREDALRHCVLAGEAVEVKLSSSALRMLAGAPEPRPGPLPEEKQAAVVRREACVLLGAPTWYAHLLRMRTCCAASWCTATSTGCRWCGRCWPAASTRAGTRWRASPTTCPPSR